MYKIINKKKLFATVCADIIGTLLFLPKVLGRRRAGEVAPEDIKNILVIRTAYIGDVVMTLPLLQPLKKRFPNARLTFLTAPGSVPVLENNPYVDEVISYAPFWFYPTPKGNYWPFRKQLKKRAFDLVIEARADIRELLLLVLPIKAKYKVSYGVGGGSYLLSHVVPYVKLKHKVDYHLDIARYLGGEIGDIEWGIYTSQAEEDAVELLLKNKDLQAPFFAAHPGSRLELKRWGAEKCAALYDRLIVEYKVPLVIFGTEQEADLVDAIRAKMSQPSINLTGQVNLRIMAAIIGKSAIFICNDSAPMHIAAAMKTPTVAIFGPSKSKETGPYGTQCQVVEKDFPCRFTCDENSCNHQRYNACLEDIDPADVVAAVHRLLPLSK